MNIQKFLWLAILASLDVAADDWQPVTGQETLIAQPHESLFR
jgi:hypothetical protein